MNKHDTNNLNFILSLSQPDFIKWYETASLDDIAYASEIMSSAVYETLVDSTPDVSDTTEANVILKKFML